MPTAETVAASVLAAIDGGRQMQPLTSDPGFAGIDPYEVTECLRRLRMARGEVPVGRKIGFTNRGIWEEYSVYEPIWGDIYDTTVKAVVPGDTILVSRLPEPRIEPEIVLGLERDLSPGMDLAAISAAIGWVAHGFEIVQSIFPGWRFEAADCVADNGLHGHLYIGPRLPVAASDRAGLVGRLAGVTVALSCDGTPMDSGTGANVLDGPIQAVSHLVEVLGKDRYNPPLRVGEIVTTGTLTRAFPISRGQHWATAIDGIDLPGLSVRIG